MSHEHWEKWRKADCIERLLLTDDLLTRILTFVKSSVNDVQWHCVVSIVNSYFNDLEKELKAPR